MAYCFEIKELVREQRALNGMTGTLPGYQEDRILCVDGLKVFQTSTTGDGTGVSNIRLYEEKDGKVVPVRCR